MKAKKRLLVAVVVLVLTMAFASSTTYAWFSMNRTVSVENMQFQIQSNNQDLYISVSAVGTTDDPTTFNSSFVFKLGTDSVMEAAGWMDGSRMKALTTDYDTTTSTAATKVTARDGSDISYAATKATLLEAATTVSDNYTGAELTAANLVVTAVSTAAADNTKTVAETKTAAQTAYNTVNSGSYTAEQKAAALAVYTAVNNTKSDNYITFDLHFASVSPYKIELQDTTTIDTVSTAPSTPITVWDGATLTGGKLLGLYNYTNSLMANETVAVGDSLITRGAYAARVGFTTTAATTGLTGMGIFDPTSGIFGNGFYDNDTANNVAYQYESYMISQTGKSATDYKFKLPAPDNIDLYQNDENEGTNFATMAHYGTGDFSSTYYLATVTVSIWLEGNDSDCLNSILQDAFSVSLKFKGVL